MKFLLKFGIISFFLICVLSFSFSDTTGFPAQLIGVEYYSKCDCSQKSPIFVRIKYEAKVGTEKNITMVHKYDTGVSITIPVTEIDKAGNIIYTYCSQEGLQKEFETTFISEDGLRSNPVKVKVKPTVTFSRMVGMLMIKDISSVIAEIELVLGIFQV